jgi:hypothetical protein
LEALVITAPAQLPLFSFCEVLTDSIWLVPPVNRRMGTDMRPCRRAMRSWRRELKLGAAKAVVERRSAKVIMEASMVVLVLVGWKRDVRVARICLEFICPSGAILGSSEHAWFRRKRRKEASSCRNQVPEFTRCTPLFKLPQTYSAPSGTIHEVAEILRSIQKPPG